MNLILVRNIFTPTSTIGDLLINHKVFCHTLEDVTRYIDSPKVPSQTAIPVGRYKVIVNMSNRFKREMPVLLNVPNFDGIRIHGGNTSINTEGCLLVAYNIINNTTIQGTAEKDITKLLKNLKEDNYIEIINSYPYVGEIKE